MPKSIKKRIIITLFLIIVLIIIAIFLIIKSIPNNLTIEMYNKIIENDNVTILLEGKEKEYQYRTTMAKKDEEISIDNHTKYGKEEQHVTTLIKEGYVYTILHDDQEYISLNVIDIDLENLIPDRKDIDGKTYENGREEINGNSFYYEEYENILTFLMLTEVHEDAKIKTRFYYDNKKNLVYIKNILEDDGEKFEELVRASYKLEVDNSLFEIPEEYAESKDEEF